jgi:hypothetical protein
MLLTLLTVVGFAVVVLALVLNAARNVARRRRALKRAELIRLRLAEEPSARRVAYRKIEIRLSRS